MSHDVALRAATAADRLWLADLLGRPEIARWLAVPAAADLDGALQRVLAGADDEGVVILMAGGAPAGCARWETRVSRSRIVSLHGVAIHPALWGHGLGAPLVRLLTDELLGPRELHRVEAETFAGNGAAIATFERCGYVREGVRCAAYDRDGAWQDSVLLAALGDAPPRSTAGGT